MVHPTEVECGQPCLSVMEAASSGLAVISCFDDDPKDIWGILACNRDVESIKEQITKAKDNWVVVSRNARSYVEQERSNELHWLFHEKIYESIK